jgi:hypothetical protein
MREGVCIRRLRREGVCVKGGCLCQEVEEGGGCLCGCVFDVND